MAQHKKSHWKAAKMFLYKNRRNIALSVATTILIHEITGVKGLAVVLVD